MEVNDTHKAGYQFTEHIAKIWKQNRISYNTQINDLTKMKKLVDNEKTGNTIAK